MDVDVSEIKRFDVDNRAEMTNYFQKQYLYLIKNTSHSIRAT